VATPTKNELDQSEFERALADGVPRFSKVDVRFEAEVVDLAQEADYVIATLAPRETVLARYVSRCEAG
jgi:2-polyprenyl-6-methoxyphenol hydroxylase-like FAD-dependent oxidoreductase